VPAAPRIVALFLLFGCRFGFEPLRAPHPDATLAPGYVHVGDGATAGQLVDGSGAPLRLRGVMLSGWLSWTSYHWYAGASSEPSIRSQGGLLARLETLGGQTLVQSFTERVFASFMTEADIAEIARLGFNAVIIPLNHDSFDGGLPVAGLDHLDRLLDACEAHGVYAVLALASLPHPQSLLADWSALEPLVWTDWPRYRDVSCVLWGKLAGRYRERRIVAAYDLAMGPSPPDDNRDLLRELYRCMIEQIRGEDDQHLVIAQGAGLGSEFDLFTEPLDPNQAYGMQHLLPSQGSVMPQLEAARSSLAGQTAPLLVSAFGLSDIEGIREQAAAYEQSDVAGWFFTPWKNVEALPGSGTMFGVPKEQFRLGPLRIAAPTAWNALMSWILEEVGSTQPTPAQAMAALEEFLRNATVPAMRDDVELRTLLTGFRNGP
jgi:hypothetical protein